MNSLTTIPQSIALTITQRGHPPIRVVLLFFPVYNKTTTMSVIVGALGMIKKGQINTLTRNLAVSASLYETQKIALYRTSRLLRRVVSK